MLRGKDKARYQPRTTLQLILHGFAFVALPLVMALGFAVLYLDRLVDQSENAVYKAVQATRDSRLLTEQVVTLERYARQYLVLRDGALLEAYEGVRGEFLGTAAKLARLASNPQLRRAGELAAAERLAFEELRQPQSAQISSQQMEQRFVVLADLADDVLAGSNRLIDREVQVMQQTASEARRVLFGLAIALIPLTLLSVSVFTGLISRPIRQVDAAIRNLGDGDFEREITVSGPHDLQDLGKRLDWLRERLRELEQQKSRFLQHVSHELKTPLTAIRESGELLADGVVGPLTEPQAEIAQILRANVRQLQSLIEDLLNFGTAQTHRPALCLSEIEFAAVIGEVVQNHKPALLAKGIELDSQLEEIHLSADREKLGTVVDNLLANAVKFSPPGGRIELRLAREHDEAILTVRDQGPGIDKDEQQQVFEAFFQGRKRPSGYVKGSGLGLSIAREYIHAHGGRIEVVDQTGGACLLLGLPLSQSRNMT